MGDASELPATSSFPNLAPGNHRITSPRTMDYNCIAWAAGDDVRWWWPIKSEDIYWPEGISKVENLPTFVVAFATLGYEPCEGDDLEPGVEKVAIYAVDETPKHAARQLADGWWTSKLGKSVDIAHTLKAIAGPAYGQAVLFLSRPRAAGGASG